MLHGNYTFHTQHRDRLRHLGLDYIVSHIREHAFRLNNPGENTVHIITHTHMHFADLGGITSSHLSVKTMYFIVRGPLQWG